MRIIFTTFIVLLIVCKIYSDDEVPPGETLFKVKERINCLKQQYWFYRTLHYEEDNFDLSGDFLLASRIHKFNGQNNVFIEEDQFTEDGDYSSSYEIVTEIYHNCTANGTNLVYRIHWPDFPVKSVKYDLLMDYVIDEMGEFAI